MYDETIGRLNEEKNTSFERCVHLSVCKWSGCKCVDVSVCKYDVDVKYENRDESKQVWVSRMLEHD